MLLLTSLVNHLKSQPSPIEAPKSTVGEVESKPIDAPSLAKILHSKPKLMIELAIEMTKLTQKEN